MKYSIIGIIVMALILGGIYFATENGSQASSAAPTMPQSDNVQYNIKID